MKQNRIGIYGGTFDPVHIGHMRTALDIMETFHLDQMRFIPCKIPVHKAPAQANEKHRLAMLKLACEKREHFIVDDRELTRTTPSYMVETLKSLHEEYPKSSLYLILGADALKTIPTWHQTEKLPTLCHIIAMNRPSAVDSNIKFLGKEFSGFKVMTHAISAGIPEKSGLILPLTVTQLDISSTYIRTLLAQHRSIDYLVEPKIVDYIRVNGLYGG